MTIRILLAIAIAALALSAAAASDHDGHHSKYAGEQSRPIKSLSAEDIAELERGGGWGLAKAAEFNGVPGPAHLLELRHDIGLTGTQVAAITALYEAMKSRAIAVGARLIELEGAIKDRFRDGTITEAVLRDSLRAIGRARTELRFIHLSTHLETPKILSTEQTAAYNRLRGYTAADPCADSPPGHDADMWRRHNRCD